MTLRTFATTFTTLAAVVVNGTIAAQTAPQGIPRTEKLVPTASLEPLLPAPEGWTRTRAGGDRVTVSESCGYSFADATYMKDGMKVRLTLADTGRNDEALGVLATMVISLPENYVGTVPPATTVARLTVHGMPAASRWDDKDKEGEFTVLVGGRFVAKAEGTKVTDLATLRGIVELVDLKKLGELK
jgi:hypothetical protein